MTTAAGSSHAGPGHAVVLGAGIAGLLAARVAADFFDEVTIIERDGFDTAPGDTGHRRGVPQGRHLHALMERGRQIIDELFPSFTARLAADGVPTIETLVGSRWYIDGRRVHPASTGLTSLLASRPALEEAVRDRVLALPNVRPRPRHNAVGLVALNGTRVGGVRVVSLEPGAGEECVMADLVVDATGRGSRAAAWLATLGQPAPVSERVDVDLGYASRGYRRRPGDLAGDGGVIVSTLPGLRGGGAVAQESGRWIVTLAGMLGDHPPTDPDGFTAFAASLPVPDIHRLITTAEPLGDAVPHRFRGSLRRRYDRLRGPCEGFITLGDAACSLNPLYAQGMTVAAQQALVLRDCLRSRGTDRLARRFFAAAADPIGQAWAIATDSDLRYPEVRAPRHLRTRLVNAYVPRVQAAAHLDPVVARRFLRVVNLVEPPSALMTPAMMTRVARGRR